MIYKYDNAIVEDLRKSFNSASAVVKVIDPEHVIELAAQISNDDIEYPVVALTRKSDTSVDTARTNFTRQHFGVQTVIDTKTNNIYYEKCIPIQLEYTLTVLTTNLVDMDEIVKEILFKYLSMYFLRIELPYECNRSVRFGVIIPSESAIDRQSSTGEYLATGKLYQTIIPLRIEGAVLVSYTPAHLKRTIVDGVEVQNPTSKQ